VTATHHVAHGVGSTGSEEPPYRVKLSVGRHQLLADEPPAEDGGDVGPTPMGLLVSALAACTAITLRIYAARKDFDLDGIIVDVRYDVAESGETSIERTITVPRSLPADRLLRPADIAERTPVTLAIRTPSTTRVQPGPEI
jgi:putative redox protein